MLFDHDSTWWQDKKAYWTSREIAQQPETWRKTIAQMAELQKDLQPFLNQTLSEDDYSVVFTGAGTSEFVGNSIYPYVGRKTAGHAHSYASTDITAQPEFYIFPEQPTLLVSFGRSGNSPESVGAIETANAYSDKVRHLLITCNENGALSKLAQTDPDYFAIDLTPETHDQSFAMTSSFSNMYLAALLAFAQEELAEDAGIAADQTEKFLKEDWKFAKEIVDDFDFNRIVYLGSNNNKGVAQESALKMCELTAGNVDTVFDTPLGFRHGPKSVINDNTLVVLYLSDDPYTRKYEMDLLKEIASQRKGDKIAVLSGQYDPEAEKLADYYYSFDNPKSLENVLLGLEYISAAQLIAMFKSLKSQCTPDNPCPTGEVNRVVKGVTLYPYEKEGK